MRNPFRVRGPHISGPRLTTSGLVGSVLLSALSTRPVKPAPFTFAHGEEVEEWRPVRRRARAQMVEPDVVPREAKTLCIVHDLRGLRDALVDLPTLDLVYAPDTSVGPMIVVNGTLVTVEAKGKVQRTFTLDRVEALFLWNDAGAGKSLRFFVRLSTGALGWEPWVP